MESSNVQVITMTGSAVSEAGSSSASVLSSGSSVGSGSPIRPLEPPFTVSNVLEPEPGCKRRRLTGNDQGMLLDLRRPSNSVSEDKLEERLWSVLCCAVCLELPVSAIYQCSQGHLICTQCFNHILADARLKDDQATCASCRCAISRDTCTRNLAVEKAVREMPGICKHCSRQLPRMQLPAHETEQCEERPVYCGFRLIGCPWRGPSHERALHEQSCIHPKKSGREVLESMVSMELQKSESRRLNQTIFSLLSCEKLSFSDVQFRPYRTDEYIHRLFYETARFPALNYNFVVKARINDDQKDPTLSCERYLTYQLVLKSKISSPLSIHYLMLKGPFEDLKIEPKIYQYEFTENNCESPYLRLPLVDSAECNRVVALKTINCRLVMFVKS